MTVKARRCSGIDLRRLELSERTRRHHRLRTPLTPVERTVATALLATAMILLGVLLTILSMEEAAGWRALDAAIILRLQEYSSPGLTRAMQVASFLGSAEFYALLLPVVVVVLGPAFAVRLTALSFVSVYMVALGKVAFRSPRPYWQHETVRGLQCETDYGYPSGHSLMSVVVLAYIAQHVSSMVMAAAEGVPAPKPGRRCSRRSAFPLVPYAVAISVISSIMLSRMYLGVHFPSQVGGGALKGILILTSFLLVEDRMAGRVGRFFMRLSWREEAFVWFALTLLVSGVAGLVHWSSSMGWIVPEAWESRVSSCRGLAVRATLIAEQRAMLAGFVSLGVGLLVAGWGRTAWVKCRKPDVIEVMPELKVVVDEDEREKSN